MVPQNAQIRPNLDFAAGTPNIAQNTCLCQILGYLGDQNRIYDHFWPNFSLFLGPKIAVFARVRARYARHTQNFWSGRKPSEAVKKVLRHRQKLFFFGPWLPPIALMKWMFFKLKNIYGEFFTLEKNVLFYKKINMRLQFFFLTNMKL